jgi:hypothetical protein
VQGSCYSGPVHASDVIISGTSRRDLIEVSSSSYGLSLFSSKVGSHPDESAAAAPSESSSVSVGELWLGIDLLDEGGLEGTFVVSAQDLLGYEMSCSCMGPQGPRRMRKGSLCMDQKAPVDRTLGSSSAPPHCCGGGSTKNKAAWILADASRAISPWMRRSFVDRQYSPSTGMDQSEWEIILDEIICMGLLVKQELVSEGEDQ